METVKRREAAWGQGRGSEEAEPRGLLGSETTLYDTLMVKTAHRVYFVQTHKM